MHFLTSQNFSISIPFQSHHSPSQVSVQHNLHITDQNQSRWQVAAVMVVGSNDCKFTKRNSSVDLRKMINDSWCLRKFLATETKWETISHIKICIPFNFSYIKYSLFCVCASLCWTLQSFQCCCFCCFSVQIHNWWQWMNVKWKVRNRKKERWKMEKGNSIEICKKATNLILKLFL